MRQSSSVATLPSLATGQGSASATRRRSATKETGLRQDGAASAPSLSMHALTKSCADMRDGVDRVVARLTDRPGVGPLLLHGATHAASKLKIAQQPKRRGGLPPPNLLTHPPPRKGAFEALLRRSNVLTQIADELGGRYTGTPGAHFSDDEGEVEAPSSGRSSRANTADPLPGRPDSRMHQASFMSSRGSNGLRSSSRAALLPGSRPTSSLHAQRAAASKSAAILDTRIDAYLVEYKRMQQRSVATVAIQSVWRGRQSRSEADRVREEWREEWRPVLRAWRLASQIDRRNRRTVLSHTLWAWYQQQLEALYDLGRLGQMLTRAIGTSYASRFWRTVVDKRKRKPRPPDLPPVAVTIRHCMNLHLSKRILKLWRKHIDLVWVRRQQAAQKIRIAAKPSNLWPRELLALALLMWSRIAKFRVTHRAGLPPPVYIRYVQQWHEWESLAIQKQMRAQVASELQGPALLRRLMHKWKSLPALEQEERCLEAEANQMRMQLYGGSTIARWKGLLEWRRAHRGFLKLMMQRWRHWASAHKHATRVTLAAASRHRLTSLAQHFEIIQQHTVYRRRLSAACTLRIQMDTGRTVPAYIARKAAFLLMGERVQAVHVSSFCAWKQLTRSKRGYARFRSGLADAHARALLTMILIRWRLCAVEEDASATKQSALVDRWQEATAAYVWPMPGELARKLLSDAARPQRGGVVAQTMLRPLSTGLSPDTRIDVHHDQSSAPAASTPTMDMQSVLMWQALAALAPSVLSETRALHALLNGTRAMHMKEKRNQALALLPAGIASRRSTLVAMRELAQEQAIVRMRQPLTLSRKLLTLSHTADHAQNINQHNPKFTLARRQAEALKRPGSAAASSDTKSGRSRSAKGKRGGPADKTKRARTPPALPLATASAAVDSDAAEEKKEEWAPPELPPTVPRSAGGRRRPTLDALPLLPWEMPEDNKEDRDEEPEGVAAISALRALATQHIKDESLQNPDEVFEKAMAEALTDREDEMSAGSAWLSGALEEASRRLPRVETRAHRHDGVSADDGCSGSSIDDADESSANGADGSESSDWDLQDVPRTTRRKSPSSPAPVPQLSQQHHDPDGEYANASDISRASSPGSASSPASPSSKLSVEAAAAAAMTAMRMVIGKSSHLTHLVQQEEAAMSPRQLQAKLEEGYQMANFSLHDWSERKEREELERLRGEAAQLGTNDFLRMYEFQPKTVLSTQPEVQEAVEAPAPEQVVPASEEPLPPRAARTGESWTTSLNKQAWNGIQEVALEWETVPTLNEFEVERTKRKRRPAELQRKSRRGELLPPAMPSCIHLAGASVQASAEINAPAAAPLESEAAAPLAAPAPAPLVASTAAPLAAEPTATSAQSPSLLADAADASHAGTMPTEVAPQALHSSSSEPSSTALSAPASAPEAVLAAPREEQVICSISDAAVTLESPIAAANGSDVEKAGVTAACQGCAGSCHNALMNAPLETPTRPASPDSFPVYSDSVVESTTESMAVDGVPMAPPMSKMANVTASDKPTQAEIAAPVNVPPVSLNAAEMARRARNPEADNSNYVSEFEALLDAPTPGPRMIEQASAQPRASLATGNVAVTGSPALQQGSQSSSRQASSSQLAMSDACGSAGHHIGAPPVLELETTVPGGTQSRSTSTAALSSPPLPDRAPMASMALPASTTGPQVLLVAPPPSDVRTSVDTLVPSPLPAAAAKYEELPHKQEQPPLQPDGALPVHETSAPLATQMKTAENTPFHAASPALADSLSAGAGGDKTFVGETVVHHGTEARSSGSGHFIAYCDRAGHATHKTRTGKAHDPTKTAKTAMPHSSPQCRPPLGNELEQFPQNVELSPTGGVFAVQLAGADEASIKSLTVGQGVDSNFGVRRVPGDRAGDLNHAGNVKCDDSSSQLVSLADHIRQPSTVSPGAATVEDSYVGAAALAMASNSNVAPCPSVYPSVASAGTAPMMASNDRNSDDQVAVENAQDGDEHTNATDADERAYVQGGGQATSCTTFTRGSEQRLNAQARGPDKGHKTPVGAGTKFGEGACTAARDIVRSQEPANLSAAARSRTRQSAPKSRSTDTSAVDGLDIEDGLQSLYVVGQRPRSPSVSGCIVDEMGTSSNRLQDAIGTVNPTALDASLATLPLDAVAGESLQPPSASCRPSTTSAHTSRASTPASVQVASYQTDSVAVQTLRSSSPARGRKFDPRRSQEHAKAGKARPLMSPISLRRSPDTIPPARSNSPEPGPSAIQEHGRPQHDLHTTVNGKSLQLSRPRTPMELDPLTLTPASVPADVNDLVPSVAPSNSVQQASTVPSGASLPLPACLPTASLQLLEPGVSVSVGSQSVPISRLPSVVSARLTEANFSSVEASVLGDALRVTAHSPPLQLTAKIVQPSPSAQHKGARPAEEVVHTVPSGYIERGSVVALDNGEVISLGDERLEWASLRAALESQLHAAGYTDVMFEVNDDLSVHLSGRSSVLLIANVGGLPQTPQTGGKHTEASVRADSMILLKKAPSILLGPEPTTLFSLPAVVARKLGQMGYLSVQCSMAGDVLRASARMPVRLRADVDSLAQLTRLGQRSSSSRRGAPRPSSDVAEPFVAAGSSVMFHTGQAVSVGPNAIPLSAMPSLINRRLEEQGCIEVQSTMEQATIVATGLAKIAMTANLSQLPRVSYNGAAAFPGGHRLQMDIGATVDAPMPGLSDASTEGGHISPMPNVQRKHMVGSTQRADVTSVVALESPSREHPIRSAASRQSERSIAAHTQDQKACADSRLSEFNGTESELAMLNAPRAGSPPHTSGLFQADALSGLSVVGANAHDGGPPVVHTPQSPPRSANALDGRRPILDDVEDAGWGAEERNLAKLVTMLDRVGSVAPRALDLAIPPLQAPVENGSNSRSAGPPKTRTGAPAFREGDDGLLPIAEARSNSSRLSRAMGISGESCKAPSTETTPVEERLTLPVAAAAEAQNIDSTAAVYHLGVQASKHKESFQKRREALRTPQERLYERQVEQMLEAEARLAGAVAADRQHAIAQAAKQSLHLQISEADIIDPGVFTLPKQQRGTRQRTPLVGGDDAMSHVATHLPRPATSNRKLQVRMTASDISVPPSTPPDVLLTADLRDRTRLGVGEPIVTHPIQQPTHHSDSRRLSSTAGDSGRELLSQIESMVDSATQEMNRHASERIPEGVCQHYGTSEVLRTTEEVLHTTEEVSHSKPGRVRANDSAGANSLANERFAAQQQAAQEAREALARERRERERKTNAMTGGNTQKQAVFSEEPAMTASISKEEAHRASGAADGASLAARAAAQAKQAREAAQISAQQAVVEEQLRTAAAVSEARVASAAAKAGIQQYKEAGEAAEKAASPKGALPLPSSSSLPTGDHATVLLGTGNRHRDETMRKAEAEAVAIAAAEAARLAREKAAQMSLAAYRAASAEAQAAEALAEDAARAVGTERHPAAVAAAEQARQKAEAAKAAFNNAAEAAAAAAAAAVRTDTPSNVSRSPAQAALEVVSLGTNDTLQTHPMLEPATSDDAQFERRMNALYESLGQPRANAFGSVKMRVEDTESHVIMTQATADAACSGEQQNMVEAPGSNSSDDRVAHSQVCGTLSAATVPATISHVDSSSQHSDLTSVAPAVNGQSSVVVASPVLVETNKVEIPAGLQTAQMAEVDSQSPAAADVAGHTSVALQPNIHASVMGAAAEIPTPETCAETTSSDERKCDMILAKDSAASDEVLGVQANAAVGDTTTNPMPSMSAELSIEATAGDAPMHSAARMASDDQPVVNTPALVKVQDEPAAESDTAGMPSSQSLASRETVSTPAEGSGPPGPPAETVARATPVIATLDSQELAHMGITGPQHSQSATTTEIGPIAALDNGCVASHATAERQTNRPEHAVKTIASTRSTQAADNRRVPVDITPDVNHSKSKLSKGDSSSLSPLADSSRIDQALSDREKAFAKALFAPDTPHANAAANTCARIWRRQRALRASSRATSDVPRASIGVEATPAAQIVADAPGVSLRHDGPGRPMHTATATASSEPCTCAAPSSIPPSASPGAVGYTREADSDAGVLSSTSHEMVSSPNVASHQGPRPWDAYTYKSYGEQASADKRRAGFSPSQRVRLRRPDSLSPSLGEARLRVQQELLDLTDAATVESVDAEYERILQRKAATQDLEHELAKEAVALSNPGRPPEVDTGESISLALEALPSTASSPLRRPRSLVTPLLEQGPDDAHMLDDVAFANAFADVDDPEPLSRERIVEQDASPQLPISAGGDSSIDIGSTLSNLRDPWF